MGAVGGLYLNGCCGGGLWWGRGGGGEVDGNGDFGDFGLGVRDSMIILECVGDSGGGRGGETSFASRLLHV